MDYRDLWRGLRVEWLHTPRGGYGYTFRVPATVVWVERKRVTIDAQLARGGTKRVRVDPANLRPVDRLQPAPRLEQQDQPGASGSAGSGT